MTTIGGLEWFVRFAGGGASVFAGDAYRIMPTAHSEFVICPLIYYYQRKHLAGFPAKRNGRRSVCPPETTSPTEANAQRPHEP